MKFIIPKEGETAMEALIRTIMEDKGAKSPNNRCNCAICHASKLISDDPTPAGMTKALRKMLEGIREKVTVLNERAEGLMSDDEVDQRELLNAIAGVHLCLHQVLGE